jgi:membrane-bound lytic murein transglycosylase D
MRDTPEVRVFLHRFTKSQRSFIVDGVTRGEPYMPLISSVMREHELPLELANVALIESQFVNDARSHRGATGMWQFMKATARLYGLKVSLWEDERLHPRRATEAAARLLKDLHEDFGDWNLAIAAYNAGPAKIRRAMKRCDTTDFFALKECGGLRKETQEFVAKFIAVTLITRHPDVYGFEEELGARMVKRLRLRADRRLR